MQLLFISLMHEQPHAVFRGFITSSGGWILLRKEFIMAEDSAHITVQSITTF